MGTRKKRQLKVQKYIDKVIEIEGDFNNSNLDLIKARFVDHEEFEYQLLEIKRKKQNNLHTGTMDFIEDEPMTIDLKIEGLKKMIHIPIEQVGVHSYTSYALCRVNKNNIKKSSEAKSSS